MKRLAIVAGLLVISGAAAVAEPVGRWFSGFGQGTVEYGMKNDSSGNDYLYIACAPEGASILVTIAGKDAPANTDIFVAIDEDQLNLSTDERGIFQTKTHVDSDTFRFLWDVIRRGKTMHARYSSGESTLFSLKGAAKILPKEPCDTKFEILYVK